MWNCRESCEIIFLNRPDGENSQIMHIFYLISLLILTSLFSTSTYANENENENFLRRCDSRLYKPTITIISKQNGWEVNSKYSAEKLGSMNSLTSSSEFLKGVTSVTSTTKIDVDGAVWRDSGTNGECFAPNIRVNLSYDPIQVSIGKEFSPLSCAYAEILRHEMQHVAIYQKNLPRIEAALKIAMEKRFSSRPIYAKNGTAKSIVASEIDNFWRPLIQLEISKIQLEQNAFDSEEEKNALYSVCLGEVRKTLGIL